MLQKIALGFVCALAAMLMEGVVEVLRVKYTPEAGGYYDVDARGNNIIEKLMHRLFGDIHNNIQTIFRRARISTITHHRSISNGSRIDNILIFLCSR